MVVRFTSRTLILPTWVLLCCMLVWCQGRPAHQLSEKDVLLLEDDENPKCFTTTKDDFTCFWEETSNKSYEFFYENVEGEKRCEIAVRNTEAGRVIHICDFPPRDVYLYVDTHIRVTDPHSNTTVYTRSVAIEDQVLLPPPREVFLQHTGQAGQLQVTWLQLPPTDSVQYEIRVSFQSGRERTDQVRPGPSGQHRLTSLPPGEVVRVQMRVRTQGYTNTLIGHWSHWSDAVSAMVPQTAEDISLFCHTSDLQNVTCQWKEKPSIDPIYTLFHKMLTRSSWSECPREQNSTSCCRFHGNESAAILVKLAASTGPLNRTFYTETLTVSKSVKTAPPVSVRGESEGDRLYLRWDTPQLFLSAHLMYQVRYQTREEGSWKLVTLPDSDTGTSLDVQTGCQYRVQVRAKPNGSVYDGYWSDWSQCLSVVVASRLAVLLLPSISLAMLVLSLLFFSVFSRYLSKLKQYLWPPVPNLDKVLLGFLTEINRQTWDPSYNVKQSFDETPASVVEILSEREAPDGKPPGESSCLLPPERGSGSGEQTEPTRGITRQVSVDYVILNTVDAINGSPGNEYMYDGVGCVRAGVGGEDHQWRYHCSCPAQLPSLPPPSSSATTEILNRSYLHMAEFQGALTCQLSKEAGNIYANLEREVAN
ncbi:thrombopoietin receptor [Osmerus mordax]|uniref:thrombopoietin receptor n=1 Tax=Osmerus mordax TaxID=8014 RepID=UPI00350FF981